MNKKTNQRKNNWFNERYEVENLIGKKNKLPKDKALLIEYQSRYENNKLNWFTDGGCRN